MVGTAVNAEMEKAVGTQTMLHRGIFPSGTETNHQDPQSGWPVQAKTLSWHHSNPPVHQYRYTKRTVKANSFGRAGVDVWPVEQRFY